MLDDFATIRASRRCTENYRREIMKYDNFFAELKWPNVIRMVGFISGGCEGAARPEA